MRMSDFRWVLQGAEGGEIRTTDPFPTQEEAESWMGSTWQGLLEEGGAFVVLLSDEDTVYRMSLAEA